MSDKFRFGTVQKDPDALKRFTVDWSAWLTDQGSDTISSVAWTVPAGITKDSQSNSTTVATIWLTGGTISETYEITCAITTAAGAIEHGTFKVEMVEK